MSSPGTGPDHRAAASARRIDERPRSWRRRTSWLALVAATALVVAACSGSSDSGGATSSTSTTKAGSTTTATTPAETDAPEQFSGTVDAFYEVPDPLPAGAPGDLIRVQDVKKDADTVTLRIMYHSIDATGDDRATTGIVTYPTAPAPQDGWPVIAWAHGTVGLAAPCAPSRLGGAAPDFGIEGVRVATDYIGLGPVGERHGYLIGDAEGHSVIDAVRAAQRLPDAHASPRWVAVGHSQGGHAALFTHQLGQSYAPELDLLGTVAIAPAAEVRRTFGPADDIVPRMVGIMMLYGAEAEYPDIHADDYVGAEVKAKASIIDTGCSDQIIAELAGIPKATFYAHDPLTTEPAKSMLAKNDPGQVRVDAPLFIVYGTADWYVVPDRAKALFERECGIDQVTAIHEVPGADHGTVVSQGAAAITTWLQDRVDGLPAPNDCPAAP